MKKLYEDYLWVKTAYKFPRDIIKEMIEKGKIQSPKQAWRTLEKWMRKGQYDYGCCLDLGWRVDENKIPYISKRRYEFPYASSKQKY